MKILNSVSKISCESSSASSIFVEGIKHGKLLERKPQMSLCECRAAIELILQPHPDEKSNRKSVKRLKKLIIFIIPLQ
jgi:hypothetical protein